MALPLDELELAYDAKSAVLCTILSWIELMEGEYIEQISPIKVLFGARMLSFCVHVFVSMTGGDREGLSVFSAR